MIHWLKKLSSSIPNAAANKVRLWVDSQDGFFKTKDENGVVTVLGDGITSITKVNPTSTPGGTDTYRITRQSGGTFDFMVKNGDTVSSVTKTQGDGSPGTTDTYRIVFTNGTNFDFTVYNGKDGTGVTSFNGRQGAVMPVAADYDAFFTTPSEAAAAAPVQSVNGQTGAVTIPSYTPTFGTPVNLGASNQQGTSQNLARADHVHLNPVIAHEAAADPHPQYITAAEAAAAAPVQSVNGQTGAVTIPSYTPTFAAPVNLGTSNQEGTSNALARSDHVHLNPVIAHEAAADPHPQYTTAAEAANAAPVQSFNGRTGAITPQQADYDSFFTTTAEAAAAAPVQSVAAGTGITVNATTGNVTVTNADRGTTAVTSHEAAVDPHPQYTTAAEAAAAAPVQSVFGRTGAVVAQQSDYDAFFNTPAETTTQINSALTAATADTAPPAVAAANSLGTSAQFAREDHTHAGVTSFNGRQGAVTPQQADYDAFFTTTAEAAAAAPVQSVAAGTGISVNATTGNVTVTNADRGSTAVTTHEGLADPHPQYTTTAEAAAAAPVQSVAGRSGAVTLTKTDVGLGNVRNPVVASVHSLAAQTLNQTLTNVVSMSIPANSLAEGDAFEIDVIFGTLVNTTAASNLEVAVFINGTQNALAVAAMGTTAVAAPGRGGRALFKVVFRAVGTSGTALANGTIHVNNLSNFASNNVTNQTVNTTAAITLDVRARTSAATTTGTVQFAAIEQAV